VNIMKKTLSCGLAVGLAVMLAVPGAAQRAAPVPASRDIGVREPKGESVSTPEYDVRVSGGGAVRSASSSWLRVETEFTTQPLYMDEVTFTYYALLKAKKPEDVGPGGKQLNLFSGEVSYIDVPRGKWKSNMFLPPPHLYPLRGCRFGGRAGKDQGGGRGGDGIPRRPSPFLGGASRQGAALQP
jgi:hypothetical protein